MDPKRWFPMERFLELSPTTDLRDDKDLVSIFYVQAYSLAHFLVRQHTPLQFKAFCDQLRDGKSAADALRLAYHYRGPADLEARWRQWLLDPSKRHRVEALTLTQRSQDGGVVDQSAGGGPRNAWFSTWKVQPRLVFPSSGQGQGAPSGQ